jgi:fructokinase
LTSPKTILALGEVLWDLFPDGPRFGGAPANFACACRELGQDRVRVCLGSAVGQDMLGQQAIDELTLHGVETSLIPILNHQTGQVLVNLDTKGHASYRFHENSAWDHLTLTASLESLARQADVIHFGTLGQRAILSKTTIQKTIAVTRPDCWRICDINLRPPHWSLDVIHDSLRIANVLKLNREELATFAELFHLEGSEQSQLLTILKQFSLKLVVLTRGDTGSILMMSNGQSLDTPSLDVEVVDTVGAGDAFTAALALGLAFQKPWHEIGQWATEVAGYVCTQSGATPKFPAEYQLKL